MTWPSCRICWVLGLRVVLVSSVRHGRMLSAVLRPLLLLLLPLHHKQEQQTHPLASCHHNYWTIASVPQVGPLLVGGMHSTVSLCYTNIQCSQFDVHIHSLSVIQDGRLHLCFKPCRSSHLPVEDSLPRIVQTLLPIVVGVLYDKNYMSKITDGYGQSQFLLWFVSLCLFST